MTRGLHADTRVQRGDQPTSRRPSPEPNAAPTGRILLTLAAFALLLPIGLAAALLMQLHFGQSAPAKADLAPPPPRLQANPPAERRRIEATANRHVDPARVDQAARAVAAKGWDRP